MKSKPQKTTKPKSKARKRTSSRVSSAAGRLLELAESGHQFAARRITRNQMEVVDVTRLVKMVAASALSQDETGKLGSTQ